MNIVPINQLISVSIFLERDEALAVVEDPRELQRQLRKALGDSIAPTAIGHRTRKPGPKAHRAKRGAGPRRGAAQASTMTSCPVCGKECNPRGLNVHMARKHKTDAPSAGD